jgi:predicted ATPase/DNA-binding XRE family transcriptional regulator
MSDTFAGLLRRYRREAGLSQEALAEGAAISKDAVSALERGTRRAPYRDTVELLARALRLDEANLHEFEEAGARGRAQRHHPGRDGVPGSNLPQMGTMLVGRDDAADTLLERLEKHPIVTIVGPGGIGKTRVALDAGERFVQAHRIGAWFCDLAALTRGTPIAGKIASAAGVTVLGSGSAIEELTTSLRSREGLLIFDNCEHVIDEAAKAAASIAACCPGLKVLATSRQRLALHGEIVYRLGALEKAAARELFRMRASSAGLCLTPADKDLVDEICTEVENIPLAIELAAARAPLLGLSELRARLKGQLAMLSGGARDAPTRQRTMHGTIGWSYDLLNETEQALFRRLAVFAGGWGLDALDPIAPGSPIEREPVLLAFTSLVEKSLVTADLEVDPVRYRLLEPVRTFARERLRAAGELKAGLERHARWIADFATTFARSEEESYVPGAITAALRELDNARAALEWSLQPHGDVVRGARIVGGMRTCWLTMGLMAECRRWCELILEKLDVETHPVVAAPVFRALIAALTGWDNRQQVDVTLRAMPVYERVGDWSALAASMSLLALSHAEAGRLEEAERIFERVDAIGEERHKKADFNWFTVFVHRALLWEMKNRFDEAAVIIDEALALARKLQRPFQEMWALTMAGEVAFALGDREKAIANATDALAKSQQHRHLVIEIFARSNIAGYHIAGGDFERAREEARTAILVGSAAKGHALVSAILHLATAVAVFGSPREAARLKGYCDVRYAARKTMKDPAEVSSYAVLAASLEAQLTAVEIAELSREGAELDDAEATSLAAALA